MKHRVREPFLSKCTLQRFSTSLEDICLYANVNSNPHTHSLLDSSEILQGLWQCKYTESHLYQKLHNVQHGGKLLTLQLHTVNLTAASQRRPRNPQKTTANFNLMCLEGKLKYGDSNLAQTPTPAWSFKDIHTVQG